jgi:hypothetical protein
MSARAEIREFLDVRSINLKADIPRIKNFSPIHRNRFLPQSLRSLCRKQKMPSILLAVHSRTAQPMAERRN